MAIYNDESFVEKVKELAKKYELKAYEQTVGKDPNILIGTDIDRARIEIIVTAVKCTVIGNNRPEPKVFKKDTADWQGQALGYIEECLERGKQGTL